MNPRISEGTISSKETPFSETESYMKVLELYKYNCAMDSMKFNT